MKSRPGFTLIELLVVVAILGILAAMIVPRVMDRPEQARVIAAKSDIRAIVSALKLYHLDHRAYPTADSGLAALVQPERGRPYLDRLPLDPWRREYQYLYPGLRGELDVFSYGADGRPGGEGFNADIGSWDLDP